MDDCGGVRTVLIPSEQAYTSRENVLDRVVEHIPYSLVDDWSYDQP